MQKTISPLNVHKVIKKLKWNQAETQISRVSMGWNDNDVTVTKIFDDVFSVVYHFASSSGCYEMKRTYLVDLKRGVSPVDETESEYDRDRERYTIFQDAPYRPFKRNKVKWFIFELARFLKHDRVAEGSDLLREMLEKVKAMQINVPLNSMSF